MVQIWQHRSEKVYGDGRAGNSLGQVYFTAVLVDHGSAFAVPFSGNLAPGFLGGGPVCCAVLYLDLAAGDTRHSACGLDHC